MVRTIVILLALLLAGCSNPSKELFRQALEAYPKWWTKPEQLASLRKLHSIPEDYKFVHLELMGYVRVQNRNYGLCEWSFHFLKTRKEEIEVRQICYYDSDSVLMHDVKQERIHWSGNDIVDKKFIFRGG
jgi:hypothetical protein